MTAPRALVTGSGGFVGRRLCALLEAAGWEVAGADLRVPDGAADRVAADLSTPTGVDAALGLAGEVTHVFHLAAATSVADSLKRPLEHLRINAGGTILLAEALRARRPAARLVYIGSAEVYGPPQFLPMTEEHPLAPANPYAVSKAAADQYCAWLAAAGALDVVRLRPFNHTGPGQPDVFVLPSFARQIAEIAAGLRPPVLRTGNLTVRRDFLHVDDVIRAYLAAALRGRTGEAYNVCSGVSWRLDEVLDRMRALSGVEVDLEQDPALHRPADIPELRGSAEKLRADTGWEPAVSFDTLLTELLDHWRGRVAEGR